LSDPRDPIPVPSPNADWSEIEVFALTYNAYQRRNATLPQVGAMAERVERRWRAGKLPRDLNRLRTALFLEQRRAHWGSAPSGPRLLYVRALVDAIRLHSGGQVAGPGDPWP